MRATISCLSLLLTAACGNLATPIPVGGFPDAADDTPGTETPGDSQDGETPTTASGSNDLTALETWLEDEGLGFGFAVEPGEYEPGPVDCNLDPSVFGEDPHETMLGDGFWAGLGAMSTTPEFDDFWTDQFETDWGVSANSAAGGRMRTPSGSVIEHIGWVANRVNAEGGVIDEWLTPQRMIDNGELTSAWFHMEYAGAFELDPSANSGRGFQPAAFFVFADFAMVEGEVADAVFSSNRVPPSLHILLYDGQDYCDLQYILGPEDFTYAW